MLVRRYMAAHRRAVRAERSLREALSREAAVAVLGRALEGMDVCGVSFYGEADGDALSLVRKLVTVAKAAGRSPEGHIGGDHG